MAINTACDSCGTIYANLPSEYVGKTARCKKCRAKFRIKPLDPEASIVFVLPETPTLSDHTITMSSAVVESANAGQVMASNGSLSRTTDDTNVPPEPSSSAIAPPETIFSGTEADPEKPIPPIRQNPSPETIHADVSNQASGPETAPPALSINARTIAARDRTVTSRTAKSKPNHTGATRLSALGKTVPEIQATVAQPGASTALGRKSDDDALREAEGDGGAEWRVGQVILGLYEVTGILGEGGLGRVYKVRHRDWRTDLAVKTPKLEIIARPGGAEDFCREAETWVNLPLHPHIVSCYYVRSISGIPRVFAEFVRGGSLSEWIHSGRLYRGSHAEVTARIIDIAVQTARGLDYAHRQNLVHQDMKPANVLMAQQGIAKITDFGLARSKARTSHAEQPGMPDHTVYGQAGAYTPLYASPEQIGGRMVTRASDIWNWAASVVEMLTGEILWAGGPAVGDFWQQFTDTGEWKGLAPRPPRALIKLLQDCLHLEVSARPRSFPLIIDLLTEIYRDVTGSVYPRKEALAGAADAATLNNRALSFLDLQKKEKAFSFWDEALRIEPHHPESTFNRALMKYRSGSMAGAIFVNELDEMRKSHDNEWKAQYLFATAHMEVGQYDAAHSALKDILEQEGHRKEIRVAAATAKKLSEKYPSTRKRIEIGQQAVTAAALLPDGSFVILAFGIVDRLTGADNFETLSQFCSLAPTTGISAHLFDYQDSVNCMAAAPDASWVAIEGPEHELLILDRAGRLMGRSDLRLAIVDILAFADGRRLLTVGDDYVLRVWDLGDNCASPTISVKLVGHTERITCSALSSSSRFAASASRDGQIRVWNIATGNCIANWTDSSAPTSLAVDPSGRTVFSGNSSGDVKTWDVSTGGQQLSVPAHTGKISGLFISFDGEHVITSGEDGHLKKWRTDRLEIVQVFDLGSPIARSFVTRDCATAYALCADRTLHILDLVTHTANYRAPLAMSEVQTSESTLSARTTFEQHVSRAKSTLELGGLFEAGRLVRLARAIPGFNRHPDAMEMWRSLGRLLPRKGFLGGWNTRDLIGHRGPVQALAIDREGKRAVSVGIDNKLCVWDVPQGRTTWESSGDLHDTFAVALSTCGKYVLVCAPENYRIFSVEEKEPIAYFNGRPDIFAAWSEDHSFVAKNLGRTLVLRQGEETFASFDMPQSLSREARSYDGRFIFVVNGAHIQCDYTSTREPVRSFGTGGNTPTAVDVDLGCVAVLSGDDKGFLRLHDFGSGRLIYENLAHGGSITVVRISLDREFALSAGIDRLIKVWELKSGKLLRTFGGHTSPIQLAALSLDSMTAISAGADGTIKVWCLDWELEDRPWVDWDSGAGPYMDAYVRLHEVPPSSGPEFEDFIHVLQCAGYGWITKAGARAKLIEALRTGGPGQEHDQIVEPYSFEEREAAGWSSGPGNVQRLSHPARADEKAGDNESIGIAVENLRYMAKTAFWNSPRLLGAFLAFLAFLVGLGFWKFASWVVVPSFTKDLDGAVKIVEKKHGVSDLFLEIKPLLEREIGPIHPDRIRYGSETPLTYAARVGDSELIRFLIINYGAGVNRQDWHGWTPLGKAVDGNRYDAAKLLLSKGANPNIWTPEGSPLCLAIKKRSQSLMELLLKKGARVEGDACAAAGRRDPMINWILEWYSK